MPALLPYLLSTAPSLEPVADVKAWLTRHATVSAPFATPIERAAVGGFAADRLGYAFISGYGEALRQLFLSTGAEPVQEAAALCATEEGGAHPRNIKTQLSPCEGGYTLRGAKQLVTFGPLARVLFVVASEGADEKNPERNRLAFVRIPVERAGVQIKPLPDFPFVPEIPHAAVEFADVFVSAAERLPGDGYERYLKPFRTVEDCHVMAALLGFLIKLSRRHAWPQPIAQELLLLVAALQTVAAAPPLEPAVHIALGGFFDRLDRLQTDLQPLWPSVDETTRTLWERDKPLLRVAGKVRAQRLTAAWQRLT